MINNKKIKIVFNTGITKQKTILNSDKDQTPFRVSSNGNIIITVFWNCDGIILMNYLKCLPGTIPNLRQSLQQDKTMQLFKLVLFCIIYAGTYPHILPICLNYSFSDSVIIVNLKIWKTFTRFVFSEFE